MLAALTHILRYPLFPVAILGALGYLYWRGAMLARPQKKKSAEEQRPADGR